MHKSESSQSDAHKKEGAFLKSLLLHLDSTERGQLCDSLEKAEREEKCLRSALFLMVVLLMLAAGGLGYCALLLPNIFRNHDSLLVRSLFALGLASLIAQLIFLGYLFWHRTVVTRLHEECRLLVLSLARSQFKGPGTPNSSDLLAARSESPFPSPPSGQSKNL